MSNVSLNLWAHVRPKIPLHRGPFSGCIKEGQNRQRTLAGGACRPGRTPSHLYIADRAGAEIAVAAVVGADCGGVGDVGVGAFEESGGINGSLSIAWACADMQAQDHGFYIRWLIVAR